MGQAPQSDCAALTFILGYPAHGCCHAGSGWPAEIVHLRMVSVPHRTRSSRCRQRGSMSGWCSRIVLPVRRVTFGPASLSLSQVHTCLLARSSRAYCIRRTNGRARGAVLCSRSSDMESHLVQGRQYAIYPRHCCRCSSAFASRSCGAALDLLVVDRRLSRGEICTSHWRHRSHQCLDCHPQIGRAHV